MNVITFVDGWISIRSMMSRWRRGTTICTRTSIWPTTASCPSGMSGRIAVEFVGSARSFVIARSLDLHDKAVNLVRSSPSADGVDHRAASRVSSTKTSPSRLTLNGEMSSIVIRWDVRRNKRLKTVLRWDGCDERCQQFWQIAKRHFFSCVSMIVECTTDLKRVRYSLDLLFGFSTM